MLHILVKMKARWALVLSKGSTAIVNKGRKPVGNGSRLGCDDGLEAAL